MKITRIEFNKFKECQESGITNMLNIKIVKSVTGLKEDKITFIIQNYTELKVKFERASSNKILEQLGVEAWNWWNTLEQMEQHEYVVDGYMKYASRGY